jgi:FkbM family methyltransferase
MKRSDLIKLNFIRNWNFPGKERLSRWFKPSRQLNSDLKDGIILLNNEDIAIYTTADNYIEWTILNTGTYEEEIGKLIKLSLKPGSAALDIGANIGLHCIRIAQMCGAEGKVYAFEPISYLQERLKKNISLNKISNVTLFPFALADEDREADFMINPAEWNQGTFSLNAGNTGNSVQHVIIKKADDIPEIKDLRSLDLIKIDVEGYEYQVLRGLHQTIKSHQPRIIFEYDSNYWAATNQFITDCYDYLSSLNYTLYQITPVGCQLIKDKKDIVGGNLFCVPTMIQ